VKLEASPALHRGYASSFAILQGRFSSLVKGTTRMKRKNSDPVTAEMAAKIKYLVGVIGLFQHQAAAILGINQGRVSEVMNKKRHGGVSPQASFDF
jgi:hypothetical protein